MEDLASSSGWRYSNVFRIALTLQPAEPLQPTEAGHSTAEAALIVPAVVGPLVVVGLLLLAGLVWLRRHRTTMTSSGAPTLRTEDAGDAGTRKWWTVDDSSSRVELS